jgi:hypothetical protein
MSRLIDALAANWGARYREMRVAMFKMPKSLFGWTRDTAQTPVKRERRQAVVVCVVCG